MELDKPWIKKNVLILDGGGLRGLGPLLILQFLMNEIKDIELSKTSEAASSAHSTVNGCSMNEDFALESEKSTDCPPTGKLPVYRPCHYFDYIGGSSTGGLLALMLGRLRMSVDDALMSHRGLCTSFEGQSLFRVRMPWTKSIDGAPVRHYEKVIMALHPLLPSPHEVCNKFTSDPTRCKTVICSLRSSSDKRFKEPFLFRSYSDKSDYEDLGLWEVARATSPTPFRSQPAVLGSAQYYDASEYIHNSTLHILDEIERAQERSDPVEILLSIGVVSSKDEAQRKWRGSKNLDDEDRPSPDRIHKSIEARSQRWSFQHHRLDLPVRLNGNYLDKISSSSDCKEVFEKIERMTTNYLAQGHVQARLRRVAGNLVFVFDGHEQCNGNASQLASFIAAQSKAAVSLRLDSNFVVICWIIYGWSMINLRRTMCMVKLQWRYWIRGGLILHELGLVLANHDWPALIERVQAHTVRVDTGDYKSKDKFMCSLPQTHTKAKHEPYMYPGAL